MSPKYNSLALDEKEQLQEQRYEPELALLDKADFFPNVREAETAPLHISGKMTVSF